MTDREVFITAVTKLFKQSCTCINSRGTCKYRYNGKACVAGQLITDEQYIPEMERYMADELPTKYNVGWSVEQGGLVREMQVVHDDDNIENWVVRFQDISDYYDLNVDVTKLAEETGFETTNNKQLQDAEIT